MNRQRYFFLFAFAISTMLLLQTWQREQSALMAKTMPPNVPSASSSTPVPAAAPGSSAKPGALPVSALSTVSVVAEKIRIETDLYVAYVSTLGGVLESVEFKQHRDSKDKSQPFHYLQNTAERMHVAQSGLIGQGLPNHTTLYRANVKTLTLGSGQSEVALTLTPVVTTVGATVERQWVFHRDSYVIDSVYNLQNQSALPWTASAYFQLERDNLPPAGQTRFVSSFFGVSVYNEIDKYKKISFEDILKQKASFNTHPASGWIGMVEHYFVAAWFANPSAHLGTPEFFAKAIDDKHFAAGMVVTQTVQPQQRARLSVPLYVGPQEQEKLAVIAPGLELTVDYGYFTIFAVPIFKFLKILHNLLGNWGWSILLMTLIIKGVFYPLNRTSAHSMAKMKLLGPRIEHLRSIHKEDAMRMQQEIMNLYKQEKVNPAGGCLPVLVQIPIFIALYWVLLSAVELRHAPWVGWIHDLSAADPYFVLPVLYGLSSFIQIRMNPKPNGPSGDPIEAAILQYLPLAFSFMFIFFPAGMLLYWILNNSLGILQQWHVNQSLVRKGLK